MGELVRWWGAPIALLGVIVISTGCGEDTGSGDAGDDSADAAPDAQLARDAAEPPPDAGGACDEDGDGHTSMACGGDDCDDTDPARSPESPEVCDAANVDEDCDPTTFGHRDSDGDGRIDARCCNGSACGDDCDDSAAGVNPAVPEVCDGIDNDCDTAIDEDAEPVPWYRDLDGDGFGSAGSGMVISCAPVAGYTLQSTDCNDANNAIHPAAVDACEAARIDDDCSGVPNDDCACDEGQVLACDALGRCATGTQVCDRTGTRGPCSVSPMSEGAFTCNGADDDCDGIVDNGLTIDCYPDLDEDTYAPAGSTATARCPIGGSSCPRYQTSRPPVVRNIDCDDANSNVHPGRTEEAACDGVDDDCDGAIDEGLRLSFAEETFTSGSSSYPSTCSTYGCAFHRAHTFCANRAFPGACTALGGIGLSNIRYSSEAGVHTYDLEHACVVSTPLIVVNTELRAIQPVCTSNIDSPACQTAASRYCVARGYTSGILQASSRVQCVHGVAFDGVTTTELNAFQPAGVSSANARDRELAAAAAWCRARPAGGYATGIGFVEFDSTGGGRGRVVCIRDE